MPLASCCALRSVSILQHVTILTPNAGELLAIADQLRRARGQALLPRPALSGDESVEALLSQLSIFAADVLHAGALMPTQLICNLHTSVGNNVNTLF